MILYFLLPLILGNGWYCRPAEFESEFAFESEFEFGLDRDLGLPLRGAPGGDDGLLDPMSLPGAADDLDALLEGDLDALLEGDLGLTISLYLLSGKKCHVSIE